MVLLSKVVRQNGCVVWQSDHEVLSQRREALKKAADSEPRQTATCLMIYSGNM